jgi:peptidoglycan/LPS O-acetylase OafA/YrhL
MSKIIDSPKKNIQAVQLEPLPIKSEPESRPHRQKLHGLDFARYIASVQIVLFHDAQTAWVWGQIWTTFFFILSGFVLSYARLTSSKPTETEKLGIFLKRRLSNIYPLFLVAFIFGSAMSIYVGFSELNKETFGVWALVLTLQHSWLPYSLLAGVVPWFMPTWFLSALLWYWPLFAPLYQRFRIASIEKIYVAVLLLFMYGWLVLGSARVDAFQDLTLTEFKFFPLWYIHFFVAGIAIARIFQQHIQVESLGDDTTSLSVSTRLFASWVRNYGATCVVLLYAILFSTIRHSVVVIMFKYVLCLPLHGILLMSLSMGRDPVACLLKNSYLEQLGNLSFPQYILHPLLFALFRDYSRIWFWIMLTACSALAHVAIVKPVSRRLR